MKLKTKKLLTTFMFVFLTSRKIRFRRKILTANLKVLRILKKEKYLFLSFIYFVYIFYLISFFFEESKNITILLTARILCP